MTASRIEWTERSDWNPVRGCTRVSEGCRHCYAEQIAGRFSGEGQPFHGFARRQGGEGRWTGRVELVEDRLTLPLKWRRPATVFASSTSDIFHESLPDEAIDRIFAVMALAPQHRFQVLTKRSARMRTYLLADRRDEIDAQAGTMLHWDDMAEAAWPLPNVWLGVSVEDQAAAEARVLDLLATPAALRFLSCEPLLGPVDLTAIDLTQVEAREREPSGLREVDALTGLHCDGEGNVPGVWGDPDPRIDWVIAGGESGRGARPMHPDWARSLRDQCAAAGVPFFFKQWGEWLHHSQEGWLSQLIAGDRLHQAGEFFRLGKGAAGRLLDDVQHDGVPA